MFSIPIRIDVLVIDDWAMSSLSELDRHPHHRVTVVMEQCQKRGSSSPL
jgi:hypothetical protein